MKHVCFISIFNFSTNGNESLFISRDQEHNERDRFNGERGHLGEREIGAVQFGKGLV